MFANSEDAGRDKSKKVAYDNADVERVRRAHRNDLENILVFFVISALYLLTGPAVGTAKNLFRAFVAARYSHTFVYLMGVSEESFKDWQFGCITDVIPFFFSCSGSPIASSPSRLGSSWRSSWPTPSSLAFANTCKIRYDTVISAQGGNNTKQPPTRCIAK